MLLKTHDERIAQIRAAVRAVVQEYSAAKKAPEIDLEEQEAQLIYEQTERTVAAMQEAMDWHRWNFERYAVAPEAVE